ncbi:FXYD domain-containing ion transport regulator 11 [Myxocyprinus asiaticus]|uniref:FXYD domain-containing ion transport regulator 11 n=1 Tax=Myxocyprinus asiaticus TaxID=70543 RepID=UPI00222283CE|nr:FXYD domain-containing ion transport regulator 11 [Myxocyprinus asiaticus]
MSQLTALVLLTVFLTLFSQAEANPFVYNYEGLRIAGLVFTAFLVAGGVGVLCWGQCKPKRKDDEDASKI